MKYDSATSLHVNHVPGNAPGLHGFASDMVQGLRPHAPHADVELALDSPRANRLLAALPAPDYERLAPHLEQVNFAFGVSPFRCGRHITHGYFPTTCIVSRRYLMENGAAVTFAIIGREGLVGIPLLMGGEASPFQMVVQRAGTAYRIRAETLKQEFDRGGALQYLLLRYMQALSTQMGQGAVCNGHHTIEKRMCRWLLLSLDRMNSNELCMTQQQIAETLGVRRESVTEAEKKLQDSGLIERHRGQIEVKDRVALEARVCECYEVETGEFERLLPACVAA